MLLSDGRFISRLNSNYRFVLNVFIFQLWATGNNSRFLYVYILALFQSWNRRILSDLNALEVNLFGYKQSRSHTALLSSKYFTGYLQYNIDLLEYIILMNVKVQNRTLLCEIKNLATF